MFFNVKNLPLAPPYRKRLLQICANSVRNTRNQAKVEKKTARHVTTSGGKRATFTSRGAWDGWLIAGNTHDIFVMQNKLILHGHIHFKTILPFLNLSTHFPNTTNKTILQIV